MTRQTHRQAAEPHVQGRQPARSYDGRVRLLTRLRDGSLVGAFGRDVTYLTSGAAVAQVVLLASQVALARLYTPDERGAYSVAIAYAAILGVLATMRYEMAIPLAVDDREARGLLRLCLATSITFGVACQVALSVVAVVRGGLGDALGAGPGMWLVPATTMALAVLATLRLYEGRRGRFGAVGRAGVWGAFVTAAGQVGAGFVGVTNIGLTLGYAAGRLVNAATMATRTDAAAEAPAPRLEVARRWRRMPLLNMLPALLNVVSVGAVAPLVALLYGVSVAGQFGLATQVLAAPAALLGQAVAGVLYPKVARIDRESGDARSAMLTVASGLVLIALPVFLTVGLLGPELFAVVFGAVWLQAGLFAALLAPWLGANFVSSPLNSYATVRNRLGRILVIAIAETLLRLAGLYLGVALDRPVLGVLCYGLAGLVICTAFVGWVLRLAGSSLTELVVRLRLPLAVAAVAVAASLGARSYADTAVVVIVGVLGVLSVVAVCARPAAQLVRAARTSS